MAALQIPSTATITLLLLTGVISRYVFAQFGIKLEHSVSAQLRRGKLIRQKDAQPGDIVIAKDRGHLGIYAGGWNWFHAPQPGDSVKLAEIYLEPSQVVFVRIYK